MYANEEEKIERKVPGKFSTDFYYSAGSGLNLNRLVDSKGSKNRLIKMDEHNDEGH